MKLLTPLASAAHAALLLLAGAGAVPTVGSAPAAAQTVVTAVNGDPITSFDVSEYGKILKLEHKPSSGADALEAVVADRLRYDEARHWGVDASDSDLSAALQRAATALKTDTQAYTQNAAKAKIDLDTIRYHLRSAAAWDNYVRARNKGVGATEEEINAALAKGGAKEVSSYRLQEIIFIVPVGASPAVIQNRLDAAKALRNRFDGCGTGLQLARSLPDVAVKEPMTRTSDALSPALRKALADTQRGMLTAPDRTTSGIEMLAVCEKNGGDSDTLHEQMSKAIIADKLVGVSDQMYQDLRKTAVIRKN